MLHLFNSIIKTGQIPDFWKRGIVVPLHKGGNKPKKSPDSYRPIALLPCLLKLFEKILLTRIKTHVLSSTLTFLTPSNRDFNPNSALSLPLLTYKKLFSTTLNSEARYTLHFSILIKHLILSAGTVLCTSLIVLEFLGGYGL